MDLINQSDSQLLEYMYWGGSELKHDDINCVLILGENGESDKT